MSEGDVPQDWKAVGQEVVRLRRALKMRQEDLSAASQIGVSRIAEIENGTVRRRAPGTLERLSKALRQRPTHLDDILYKRSTPRAATDNPTAPEQVLRSIQEQLHSLTGKLDALLARPDILWQPRQASEAGGEPTDSGHSRELPTIKDGSPLRGGR